MNELDDKFWETAITEAATGKRPPDQVERILARLNAQPATPPAKARRRWIRYPVEAAAAAALVVVMGFATGLLKWPGEDPTPPKVVADRKWAAGPDSVVVETETSLRLERGWVLLQPGAPDVQCGESALSKIDGLVLAHAGAAPTEKQVAAAQDWLSNNQVEADMLNAKKWAAGLAMAVLVLNGSAILDGQEVKEEPNPAPVEPAWHQVRSVMDIDNLPEGVKRVSLEDQSSLLLDFLVHRKSVEKLDLQGASGMSADRLSRLSGLPALTYLDLRNVKWDDTPDYSNLEDIPLLKQLVIDPLPKIRGANGRYGPHFDEKEFGKALGVLESLGSDGVKIELSSINVDYAPLDRILAALPDMDAVTVDAAGDLHLKWLSELKHLRTLRVTNGKFSDIGVAYLAKQSLVTSLWVWAWETNSATWYQLGRIKSLRTLTVKGQADENLTEAFGHLNALKALDELDIAGLQATRWTASGATKSGERVMAPGAALLNLPSIGLLKFTPSDYTNGWEVLPQVRARQIEIVHALEDLPTIDADYKPRGEIKSQLETLVLEITNWYDSAVRLRESIGALLPVIRACTNLKLLKIKYVEDVAADEVAQLLKLLREAAPNAEVEYVR